MTTANSLNQLIETIRSKKLTVGFGESCTGGLLSATLTKVAGVSDVFMGSVVSYSYPAKVDLLGVSQETLNTEGAVSEEVALQMARGVCERLKVDCSIAITGVAGPGGGSPDKPVGTVWFAAKGPGFEVSERKLFAGDREQIQKLSVEFAVELLLNALQQDQGLRKKIPSTT
ncbi:MAG: hypothetical protein BroJett040_04310 [Oligoflexia bacterium]|nr:MAG: hypothetical protein BroJett040_04310 [Oligoflexia bacterium]